MVTYCLVYEKGFQPVPHKCYKNTMVFVNSGSRLGLGLGCKFLSTNYRVRVIIMMHIRDNI